MIWPRSSLGSCSSPGWKAKGVWIEIAIDGVDLESPAARLEGGFDPLGTMIAVPELRGDEHVLALDRPRLEHLLHRVADGLFVAVAFGAIEVTKPRFQCSLGRLFGRDGIGNQRAEPEGGHRAGCRGRGGSSQSEELSGAAMLVLLLV